MFERKHAWTEPHMTEHDHWGLDSERPRLTVRLSETTSFTKTATIGLLAAGLIKVKSVNGYEVSKYHWLQRDWRRCKIDCFRLYLFRF